MITVPVHIPNRCLPPSFVELPIDTGREGSNGQGTLAPIALGNRPISNATPLAAW